MIDIAKIKIGDRVHYQSHGKTENGMVKEIPEHTTEAVRVVYHCAGDWKNFKNYTSALTNIRDLRLGWDNDPEETDLNGHSETRRNWKKY